MGRRATSPHIHRPRRTRFPGRTPVFALACAAMLAATTAACDDASDDADPGAQRRTVVVALAAEPEGFNPHAAEHAGDQEGAGLVTEVAEAVWPSAYRIRPDGRFDPWLLSAPAVVVDDEPLTVEWRIRPDANWSDGTPITASDLELLYRHCAGDVAGAACADGAGYDRVRSFEEVDPKTVRLTFTQPHVEYQSLFRFVPPAHVVVERGGDWVAAFADDPGVSGGPFEFGEWRRGETVVLERNDAYFGERAHVDRLELRLQPERQADALRAGDVDVLAVERLSLDTLNALRAVRSAEVKTGLAFEADVLTFNLGHPLLAEPAVRRAIALAVDRDALVRMLVEPVHPDALRLDQHVFRVGQAGYRRHGEEFTTADPERARGELETAGFERGSDGAYVRAGPGEQRLELRISTESGHPRREQVVQLLQGHLAEAGIRAHVDNSPAEGLERRLAEGDFDLLVHARRHGTRPLQVLHDAFARGGAANHGRFADPRVDELLARAAREPGEEARRSLLNDLDLVLWSVLPELPLYQPAMAVAHDADLSGVAVNPTGHGILWNVEEWRYAPRGG